MNMIEINLLPKNYLKGSKFSFGKTGLYVVAAAAGVVIMLVGITFFQMYQLGELESNIHKAQQRAVILQQDIQVVDALLEIKGKITKRMQAVEKLDRHRSAWVRILEDVARNVPEYVWLGVLRESPVGESTSMQNPGNPKSADTVKTAPVEDPSVRKVEVEGYAFTLNALAAFMIKMMRSDYFTDVELESTTETKFTEEEKAYKFTMNCNLHYLSDEELRQLIAQGEVTDKSSNSQAAHKTLN